ncbi:MAG: hypothetical protein ACLRFH_00100 [Opitutales bacterium]
MKNKIILILSGLIVANTVLGDVGGEEDVFETKEDVFGSNEAQQVYQEATTVNEEVKEETILANEELKVQVIPDLNAFQERNGFVIQKGMDQYVIEYLIWDKKELDRILEKLKPLYTDKAKKLGKKPIVFKKYQAFVGVPIEETDEFSIESLWVGERRGLSRFDEEYKDLSKYGKPIIFSHLTVSYVEKIKIEKNYDLSNCKILHLECSQRINTLDEYLKFTKLGIENLHMDVDIYLELHSEKELKELLYKCIRDKRVGRIDICYNQNEFYRENMIPVPIEYASCLKVWGTPIVNPQSAEDNLFLFKRDLKGWKSGSIYLEDITCDVLFLGETKGIGKNVSCKNIICDGKIGVDIDALTEIKNLEAFWLSASFSELYKHKKEIFEDVIQPFAYLNIPVRFYNKVIVESLLKNYVAYIEEKDIVYLSGYVNLKNKPDELSDEEWKQVLVLKQKVKEIINITKNEIKMEIK